jgi:hypothetical protein
VATHSKLTVFLLDTSGGVLTNISTDVDEVGLPEELDLLDVTTFGSQSKQYIVGFADAKLTIGGPWTRSVAQMLGALKAAFRDGTLASATFEYGPEGNASGDVRYTGECVLVSVEKNSAVKDAVKYTAEFQVTGNVTENSY